MTTKLTLSIRPEMVEKAKRISRQKGKSISKMVDEFFEMMELDVERKKQSALNLRGKLKDRVAGDFDWKEALGKAIMDKHAK